MMEFSADNLKYMAAEVVTNYLANKVPLSEAVASQAVSLKLNTEQIKRLIEVSNQVAYLKLLEKATDRTFEFPLATYEDVMALLARPDESMNKEASQKLSPMEIASGKMEEELEKVAGIEEEEDEFGFLKRASKSERISLLNKQVYRVRGELEKIASDEQVMVRELIERAVDMKDDDQFMDKVAMILDGDEDTLTKIARLVYGEKVDYCADELFYESDIEDARGYVDMFKEAEELVETRKSLEEQIKRAEEVLEKEALAPFVDKALSMGKGVVSKVQSAGGKIANKAPKLAERAEAATFVADQMRKTKRDVWKSIQG